MIGFERREKRFRNGRVNVWEGEIGSGRRGKRVWKE